MRIKKATEPFDSEQSSDEYFNPKYLTTFRTCITSWACSTIISGFAMAPLPFIRNSWRSSAATFSPRQPDSKTAQRRPRAASTKLLFFEMTN